MDKIYNMDGRVVMITGGSRGLGREMALGFAAQGANVAIVSRKLESCEEAAREVEALGVRALPLAAHVGHWDELDATVDKIMDHFGRIDVLVNNAGIAGGAPIEETTLGMWQRNMDILATGYFLMAREAVKVMKKQGNGGTMVFIGSKNSIAPGKGATAYSTAKAAEIHLARSLAEELGGAGIRVNSILPDAVIQGSSIWDSDWKEARAKQYGISVDELQDHYRQRNILKTEILPDDIAEAVAFLAGPRSAKTTGGVITVDGGVSTAYVR